MWSSLNAPRTQGKLEAWAAYDYSHGDLQAGPTNGSGHMNTIAVGGDMKLSDRMLVGAMFGYTTKRAISAARAVATRCASRSERCTRATATARGTSARRLARAASTTRTSRG
jgi:hypothetical protein